MITAQEIAVNTEAAQRKARMPRFGVAIFDNPNDPVSGWACLAGQEEFRFRQPADLPSDSLWITSIDSDAWKKSNLTKTHHLRPSDFFRSKLKNIAADLGMATTGDDWARPAARALSEVVNRAALIAAQVYGWEDPLQYLRGESLADDIRKSLVRAPPVIQSMKAPLLSANQSYSSVNFGIFEQNSTMLTLRVNRLAYAKKILSTPVPDGAWTYAGQEETPNFNYSLEMATNPAVPCLVEATVEMAQSDTEIATLAAFGVGPNARGALRSWISQPELIWLSRHAKIKISRAYYTSNSRTLVERMQLPELLVADDMWELSIAAGLVAESHWSAIAALVMPPYGKKKEASIWGVWLRAVDRALCFDLALRAHRAGFNVRGYGNGSIMVEVMRTKLHSLLEFSMENGIAHPAFREVFERNGLV